MKEMCWLVYSKDDLCNCIVACRLQFWGELYVNESMSQQVYSQVMSQ